MSLECEEKKELLQLLHQQHEGLQTGALQDARHLPEQMRLLNDPQEGGYFYKEKNQ